jgi:2-dehydro-3-deoxygalactonokinase
VNAWRIYGDWGSTRLRLWRIERGTPVDFCEGLGIGELTAPPEQELHDAIAPWCGAAPPDRIVLCGMVGARNGLREVGYVDCPADAVAWRRSAADLAFAEVPLRIAAGVACRDDVGRADVMRGEETQVLGAIRLDPALGQGRHVAVLPGTHSKWVTIQDGRIATFRTFLTGEIFALLQRSSLLAAGRSGGGDSESDGGPSDGFACGLARAAAGAGPLGDVFEARAAQLRDGRGAGWARDFLSGLLIGGEIAERRRLGGLPREVTVVGGARLADRYIRALAEFDIAARPLAGDTCALAGLELLDADD